ncbi:SDR family NAD(P)-dependent oxidoreductase [Candidatus Nitrosocosmicus agrestis]|jgi:3-oxoacyl-[acyl-carrier protein] reductase|uniref:SDR family NAD(P)-dependent oxidoreductase n=1 Tax=Candidatus Nitrosocosmicus agrestis TaxID=2563600 RepID=UPI00122EA124|nr:SDR family oxidoreductase [Candidatus Nitrosocosmicus sp. SS]KAA2282795.1 SDR family oxidoreductase [Candidatus Nitrosocosmicus sp. SS]KAF0870271.1 SDR family oxidoreductase [Candidatus Nitrosocosmicus sp. SS]
MSLKGKVVLVTGSSKGIGFEIAREFAENKNSNVILCSRSIGQCDSAVKRIKGSTFSFEVDVADDSSVEKFIKKISDKFDRVDVLVNNSGYPYDSLLWNKKPHEVTISELERVLSVDLLGSVRLSRAIIPLMLRSKATYNGDSPADLHKPIANPLNNKIEDTTHVSNSLKKNYPKLRGGVIITISSTPAISGQPGGFPYSIAKAGNIALTKCIAKEYGQYNIRAYSLALGNISTKATINSLPESMIIKAAKESPMNRWGDPIEVAKVATSIAEEDFSFANGNTIVIDGGTIIL